MLKSIQNYKNKTKQYYAKHPKQQIAREYVHSLIAMLFSAFLFAFAFKVFLSPSVDGVLPLISGGTAGLARTVGVLFEMGGIHDTTLIYSIFYALFNIPIIYLAFRRIGFRFALFTMVNVVATSILTNYALNFAFIDELAESIACVTSGAGYQSGLLARAILAGVINGAASAIALGANGSAGGVDTVGYYFSLRKSNNVGRYTIIINSFVFVLFASLNTGLEVMNGTDPQPAIANMLLILLFVTLYSIMNALVMDIISRHNKKEQIQIITKVENLSKLLLANIPHGATIVRSKGAFTGEDHIIIYVIVSTYETKAVVDLVREADPHSFIAVTPIQQVYGRFRKPKIK